MTTNTDAIITLQNTTLDKTYATETYVTIDSLANYSTSGQISETYAPMTSLSSYLSREDAGTI